MLEIIEVGVDSGTLAATKINSSLSGPLFIAKLFAGLSDRRGSEGIEAGQILKSEAVRLCEAAFALRRRNAISDTDSIVFRMSPLENWAKSTKIVDLLIQRLNEYGPLRNPLNPMIVIYSADYSVIANVIFDPNGLHAGKRSEDIVREIRERELSTFVTRTEAVFEFGTAALFALPSGVFADYFFRVGNLQSDPGFCRSIFFWTLPYLRNASSIVTDTWSISTTAAYLGTAIERYAQQKLVNWSYLYDYLPTSREGQDRLKRAISALAQHEGSLVFVNSFRSSGRLEGEVATLAQEFGMTERVHFLSVYADAKEGEVVPSTLCNLGPHLREMNLAGRSNAGGRSDMPIFSVNSRTYFPDFRRSEVRNFSVLKYAEDKEFFERYAGRSIFKVCRTGRTSTYTSNTGMDTKLRHHSFHVDLPTMFSTVEFSERLKGMNLPKASAIFTNGSNASQLLAQQYISASRSEGAREFKGNSSGFLDVANNKELAAFLLQEKGQTIVFSVPAVISGTSLGNLQEQLRRIVGSADLIRANIVILIGLLRPEHPEKLARLKGAYLKRPESFETGWREPIVVESAILPNWQEEQCPWLSELRTINRTLSSPNLEQEERAIFLHRKEALEISALQGLSGPEVFLVRKHDQRLRFNPGSLWFDINAVDDTTGLPARRKDYIGFLGDSTISDSTSEGDLCCAVASAIQRWRVDASKSALQFVTIDAAVLTDHNGFNEARLRAAIWRSLTPTERTAAVRSVQRANDFPSMCQRIFSDQVDPNFNDLELEAMLAFGRDLARIMGGTEDKWDWNSAKILTLS